MDNILVITVLTILLTAFVGTMIRYRTRDKCLKGFRDFFVTLELSSRPQTWGRLAVYHNGLELVYPSAHLDPDGGHLETSYILFQNQFGDLLSIRRYHDELSAANQARRERELRQTYHPGVWRRSARRLRNLFNLLRDAFSQALGLFIGALKKGSSSTFLATQDQRINETTRQLITSTASAYEPILEKHIGHKVVLETMRDGKKLEYCGVLKEYTEAFVTLLNVQAVEDTTFHLADFQQLKINRGLDFELSIEPDGAAGSAGACCVHVTVHNHGARPVHLLHVRGSGIDQVLDAALPVGERFAFAIPGVPAVPCMEHGLDANPPASPAQDAGHGGALPELRLSIRAQRAMDVIMPRTLATVRHGAETTRALPFRWSIQLVTPLTSDEGI